MKKKIFLKKIFGPYFLDEISIFSSISNNQKFIKGKLLDIGCRDKPYEDMFEVKKYIGIDIVKSDRVDIVCDAINMPFKKEEFDSVFSTQVVTDIYQIDKLFDEVFRVLKRKGHLMLTVEFVMGLNDEPYDFYRFTKHFYKKKLLEKKFKEVEIVETAPDCFSVGYLFNCSLWKSYLNIRYKLLKAILFPFLLLAFVSNNIFFYILGQILRTYKAPLGYLIKAKK